ncbi:MAG: VanZ family protein [Bacteroidales bacterium]|nr:VanZ family protein [Bacteroidales bacterium]
MRGVLPHIKTAGVAGVILLLSLGDPGTAARPVYNLIPHADKLFHVIMYFSLTVVVLVQYRHLTVKTATVVLMVMGAFAYGVIIEFLQRWLTSGRSFELADILFNLAGIISATILFFLFRKRRAPRPER